MNILPCPYPKCSGGFVVSHTDRNKDHSIFCMECGMQGPLKPTEAEAIAAWNEVAGLRKTCEWTTTDDIGYYDTGCGCHRVRLVNMFCPYCGGKLPLSIIA